MKLWRLSTAQSLERYVVDPRHIEVQIIGDGNGNVVHLYDRDCSLQRRHQKVLETAPAMGLDPKVREAMLGDAVRLTSKAKYRNAGTVEFWWTKVAIILLR